MNVHFVYIFFPIINVIDITFLNIHTFEKKKKKDDELSSRTTFESLQGSLF